MNKGKSRTVLILLIIVVIIGISYLSQPTAKTIQAITTNYEEKIPFNGLYFTQESVLYEGAIIKGNLKVQDGVKIPIGINVYNNILSKEAGVICTHIDGYENVFNIDNISKVNSSMLNKIANTAQRSGIKIINNSEWFIYARTDKNEIFKKFRVYMLMMDNSEYPSQIIELDNKIDGNYIVFKVENDLNILNLHRNIKGYIIKSRYNGIVVPIKALYNKNEELGVLIKSHGYSEFRRVNLLFKNNDIAVISPLEIGQKLQEYDDIICNSYGLKDGIKIR